MKHNTGIIAATTTVLLLCITAGIAEDRTFEFDPIHIIEARAGISVSILKGDVQSIVVTARTPADFDHLELTWHDGSLLVTQEYSLWDTILSGGLLSNIFKDGPNLEVKLTLPSVQTIQASSGAEIIMENMSGEHLRATVSSGASIEINMAEYNTYTFTASSGAEITADGSCVSIIANVSSGADIQAADLMCVNASATASSGGEVKLFTSKTLDANASSGGEVNVLGEPKQADTSSSSGGEVNVAH